MRFAVLTLLGFTAVSTVVFPVQPARADFLPKTVLQQLRDAKSDTDFFYAVSSDLETSFGIEVKTSPRATMEAICYPRYEAISRSDEGAQNLNRSDVHTILTTIYLLQGKRQCANSRLKPVRCFIDREHNYGPPMPMRNSYVSCDETSIEDTARNSELAKTLKVWVQKRISEIEKQMAEEAAAAVSKRAGQIAERNEEKQEYLARFKELQGLQAEATQLAERQSQCEDGVMYFNVSYNEKADLIRRRKQDCMGMTYKIATLLQRAKDAWPYAFYSVEKPVQSRAIIDMMVTNVSLKECREIVKSCETSSFKRLF